MKYPSKCKLEQVVKHLKEDVAHYKEESKKDKSLMKKLKKHPAKKNVSKKMHKAGKKAAKALKKDIKVAKKEGKMSKVMHEYKEGSLHSGSKKGPKVKSRKQAIAIGLSEARKAGESVKPRKKKK